MKKIIIEKPFWDVFPDARVGIIVCTNLTNHRGDEGPYRKLLDEAQTLSLQYVPDDDFTKNAVIASWREAFQKFKTRKGARCCIEALLKRVKKGDSIATINPLVDMYNAVSLMYGVPCGGYDLNKLEGDVRLTRAFGTEEFTLFGSEEQLPPYEGEVVYKDDKGVLCRCWNWRESERIMLTEQTSNALMCIELVDKEKENDFRAALTKLSEFLQDKVSAQCTLAFLDITKPEFNLEF